MKAIYKLEKTPQEYKALPEETVFSVTNNSGNFLMFSQKPLSRYFGWFIADNNWEVFKVIENILPANTINTSIIKNEYGSVVRETTNLKEHFIIPNQYNSLIYRLDKESEVELLLDIKRAYGNPEFGRLYTF